MLRIREFLRRVRILGSVHWLTDPDPALFVIGFQNANKIRFFAYYLLNVGTFTPVFKDNKSLRSHKRVEIEVFLNFLAC